jgi:hypothetical protein
LAGAPEQADTIVSFFDYLKLDLEFHLLDTGHFALEEDGHVIARYIRKFMETRVASR